MSTLPVAPAVALDLIKRERAYRDSERSLMACIRHSFHVIEPGVAFCDNWHLHALAEHLEAVSSKQIENLVIAIPPGCMKSIAVSVAWPAWEWIKRPELRYLGASYGADLAIRDSMKCRDVILSEWYAQRWGERVKVRQGADQKLKYELTAGGWRMATSVGGRATGEHPDRKIIDDPHNAKQAESDVEREGALNWYDRTLSSRGLSRGAQTVVVAQRFHERDLTGHILADLTGFEYLCIPMEWESQRKVTSIGWSDPRKAKGELLWPSMFTPAKVTQLKQALGSYGTSGQLQQDPVPEGGGILKTEFFKMWPADTPLPAFEFMLQSYDTAFTEDEENDPTACTVWGCFKYLGKRGAILCDAWDEHLTYPQLRTRVIADRAKSYRGNAAANVGMGIPRRPDRILVEKKASGQSLIQDLQLANAPVLGYNPGTADKKARAHMSAPTLELGVLWIPESAKNRKQFVSWAAPFLRQVQKFPVSANDDYVDSFTQAVLYLKGAGWLELPVYVDDTPVPPPKEHSNPYAQ